MNKATNRLKRLGFRTVLMTAFVACSAMTVTACGSSSKSTTAPLAPGQHPNIVFVLTDDLSMNLVQYMPHVLAMQKAGTSFSNYSVTDSLCCPSRASIFTGEFPHSDGVFTNGKGKADETDGGLGAFLAHKDQDKTFSVPMQKAGYRTAMMGKYLNGYEPNGTVEGQANYVPPGWDEWDVAGQGYSEYNYDLNENHNIVHYGKEPKDYLTDVISAKGQQFISSSVEQKKPFMLELATFAPHKPSTPAPQDADSFGDAKVPQTPAYNKLPANPPSWLANSVPITSKELTGIDALFKKRVQSVQAVDRMIGAMQDALTKAGVAGQTVFVFSSDNGFHMGDHQLSAGKQTAFETDLNVPLVMTGPNIPAGKELAQITENIDLAPTFETLAGAAVPSTVDGNSLVDLINNSTAADWRTAALFEHHHPGEDLADPDFQDPKAGDPPDYEGLRTATYTYVEYTASGGKEFYDRSKDPFELNNIAAQLPATAATQLHDALAALEACHGQTACWQAAHVAPINFAP